MRLSKAEMRVLEQFWKRGTSSVREVLEPSRYLLECGRFAGMGRALLCFVVPIATGATGQVVETTQSFSLSTALIMPGSRVRVPPFPDPCIVTLKTMS
jgi:hypothetical protein